MKLDAMSGGLTLRTMQDVARDVDAAGFDGLWVTESGRSAFTACTAVALASERLDLGTAIAVAFPRSPMVTAQCAWELAELTGGRFVLGLGTQVKAHVERRYSAPFAPPGPRMREYIVALKEIFRAFRGEERLAFEGDFYSFSLLPAMWSPGPIDVPDPPVYVAAVNPWMCRMAGEVADGVHVHPLHSVRHLEEVVRSNIGADNVAIVCPLLTIVGDTEAERAGWRERARVQLAFYGSTRTYAPVFELHGWHGTSERLHELQAAGDIGAMAEVLTDEMLDVFTVTATWDDLADAIVERYAANPVDRVICYFATQTWADDRSAIDKWRAVCSAVTP